MIAGSPRPRDDLDPLAVAVVDDDRLPVAEVLREEARERARRARGPAAGRRDRPTRTRDPNDHCRSMREREEPANAPPPPTPKRASSSRAPSTRTREIAPEDWARYRAARGGDLRGVRDGSRHARARSDTPERFLRALFEATAGLRRRPEARDDVPGRESTAAAARAEPDDRGADRVPLPLRAPRAARSSATRTSATSPASGSSASRS